MPRAKGPEIPDEDGASAPAFVELPTGIFTAGGTWFHVSRRDLSEYAGRLLDRVPLERLLESAETVVRGPATLAAWMLLGTLMLATPIEAAVYTCILYLGWSVIGPGLVVPGSIRVLGWLETVWLQGLAYVVGLSALGMADHQAAAVTGLAGFVLLRWGVLGRVLEPVARLLRSRLYPLPVPDQALRAVILRYALREGVTLPQIARMEERMWKRMSGREDPQSRD